MDMCGFIHKPFQSNIGTVVGIISGKDALEASMQFGSQPPAPDIRRFGRPVGRPVLLFFFFWFTFNGPRHLGGIKWRFK